MLEFVNIELQYLWNPVEQEPSVLYQFPAPLTTYLKAQWKRPAVYRWVVRRMETIERVYLGETVQLDRRIYQYNNPGPTQQTNIRIRDHFTEQVQGGCTITLDSLVFEPFHMGAMLVGMDDLEDKMLRRFLEHFFAFNYTQLGFTVLNA